MGISHFLLIMTPQNSANGIGSEKSAFLSVYNEINTILERFGILKFECRTVQMCYPFFGDDSGNTFHDVMEVLCLVILNYDDRMAIKYLKRFLVLRLNTCLA
ncbi:hypothetical protein MXB_4336 [Myxobolus squamalis]|nr:hypothetical protein MXB_4336 [Myxobolus squamalis]